MGKGESFTLNPGFYWEPALVLEIESKVRFAQCFRGVCKTAGHLQDNPSPSSCSLLRCSRDPKGCSRLTESKYDLQVPLLVPTSKTTCRQPNPRIGDRNFKFPLLGCYQQLKSRAVPHGGPWAPWLDLCWGTALFISALAPLSLIWEKPKPHGHQPPHPSSRSNAAGRVCSVYVRPWDALSQETWAGRERLNPALFLFPLSWHGCAQRGSFPIRKESFWYPAGW